MGFNKAQQGKILFNGQEIQEIDRHSFYEKVSSSEPQQLCI